MSKNRHFFDTFSERVQFFEFFKHDDEEFVVVVGVEPTTQVSTTEIHNNKMDARD